MKIAFQMQNMEDTDTFVTSSLYFMEEAQRRGHEVFHFVQNDLSIDHTGVYADIAPVDVDLEKDDYYKLGQRRSMSLGDFDIVFFRQLPPVDTSYLTSTYILEYLTKRGVYVTNDPRSIRDLPEKVSIFDYPEYIPPTLVSRNHQVIENFFAEYKDVVIKPLYSYHGHGIKRSSEPSIAFEMIEHYQEPLMFQPFLPEIYEGNKRIILFDGEIAGALISVPSDDDFRVYRDSVETAYEPSVREKELCDRVGEIARARKIDFIGVDFIGDYLTEINITCVGGIAKFNKIYGGKFEAKLWDLIEARTLHHKKDMAALSS